MTANALYRIDFDTCYESYPCKHNVSMSLAGNPVTTTLMSAPKILNLIIENNIEVSYKNLKHLEYCFEKPEHHALLEKLKKI